MKIVHFTTTFLPKIGGIEIVVHNLARQQQLAGHDVTVIAPFPAWRALRGQLPYRLLPLLPKSVIALEKVPTDYRTLFTPLLRLYQRRYWFDIWHTHALYSAGYAVATFLARTQQNAIVTAHGSDVQTLPAINYGQRLKPFVAQRVIETMPHFARTVAISDSMTAVLHELGATTQQLAAIPNGVDAQRIATHASDRNATRQRHNWPSDKQIILTVGRNHPKKGYSQIPEIVAKMAATRDDFLWVVIGRNTSTLQPEIERLNITNHLWVREEIGLSDGKHHAFTLPTADLIDLYHAADIFAFPSLIESFGVVLIEAMAAGLPIVTTDVPGCRDVVRDGETGLLANSADPATFAQQLIRLLDDPILRDQLRMAGLAAAQTYEWARVSEAYQSLYREVCLAA